MRALLALVAAVIAWLYRATRHMRRFKPCTVCGATDTQHFTSIDLLPRDIVEDFYPFWLDELRAARDAGKHYLTVERCAFATRLLP